MVLRLNELSIYRIHVVRSSERADAYILVFRLMMLIVIVALANRNKKKLISNNLHT